MLGGDLEEPGKAQSVKLLRFRLPARVIDLVHDEQDAIRVRTKLLREGFILGNDPGDAVHDPTQQVALFDRDLALRDDLLFERSPRPIVKAAGVHELEVLPGPLRRGLVTVPRRAGDRIDDGAAHTGDAIEKSRFADVGSPDDGYRGKLFFAHISLLLY
jgi:hypothetical protein